MAEQFDEAIDPRIPEAFVVAQPVIGASERAWVDAAVMDAPTDGAFHQSGSFQHLDVLRSCGERHPIRRRELADGVLAPGQSFEHGPTSLVTEGAEDEVEPRLMMFNHMVEYRIHGTFVNRSVE